MWVTKGEETGERRQSEESRAWKMSLSANFPEEPWLRLSLGMESVQGGGAAVSSVHPERLFAKSCYERQGAGLSGLQGEGQILEVTDLASAPGEASKLLASSLGS